MAVKNGALPATGLRALPWATNRALTATAAASLARLNTEYRKAFGVNLVVNDAYRTLARQRELYANRGRPGWPQFAAVPGTSVHGLGQAVDLGGLGGFTGKKYLWLKKNAPRHGWTNPTKYGPKSKTPEPWHWEHDAAADRYPWRKIKVTKTLDTATTYAVDRAIGRVVTVPASDGARKTFWAGVQRTINKIMAGTKGWVPLDPDGSPGPLTIRGLQRSLRKTNTIHKPKVDGVLGPHTYECWQRALNAAKWGRTKAQIARGTAP